jgi:hypothetical protein
LRSLLIFIAIAIFLGQLKAQIVDDFSDGDFTFNPAWSGNDALFLIDAGQLRSSSPGASNYYLSSPSTLSANANWEFFINLKFGTSGVNYVDIYLMADFADLNSVSNGYFIRIGGTNDEIVLYKKESGTNTALISSITGIVNSTSSNPFFIRVTRDISDLWTVFVDDGNLGSLTGIGSIVDNTINSSSNFGISITQSAAASPINNHFFDNILVETINVDNTPPTLDMVEVNSAKQLLLTFSEPLDQTIAENVNNYSIVGIGSPITALLSPSNKITITYINDLPNGDYTVEVSNIEDLIGNALIISTLDVVIFTPDVPALRDVIFTEIFPDPSPPIGLPEAEFIELYNNSDKTFDLEGWKFSDATNTVILPSYILQPSEYVIVCATSNLALFQSFGNVIGVSSFPTLNNANDNLSLKNVDNSLIDSLAYSDTWYKNQDKKAGGYTLELINLNNICAGIENWIASIDTNGGTPGMINSVYNPDAGSESPLVLEVRAINSNQIRITFSEPLDSLTLQLADFTIDQGVIISSLERMNFVLVLTTTNSLLVNQTYTLTISSVSDCTGNQFIPTPFDFLLFENPSLVYKDIIISEIMANPSEETTSPNVEYIELFNRSTNSVNIENWTITDDSRVGLIPYYILKSKEYVVLSSVTNANIFSASSPVLGVISFPSLNNTGDAIKLSDKTGFMIDETVYNSTWYRSSIKDDGGYSLEIIDPDNICGGEENWIASEDKSGGTPGSINSVFSSMPDNIGPEILAVFGITSDSVLVQFNEKLDESSIQINDFVLSNGLEIEQIVIEDSKTLYLLLNQNSLLQGGISYLIEVKNIKDCPGNSIKNLLNKATFSLIEEANNGDLLFNEILFNPLSGGVDFIEIYNNSAKFISLKNWLIANGEIVADSLIVETQRLISTDELIIGPGEYRAITTDAIILKSQYPGGYESSFIEIASLPSYSDNEGVAILINSKNDAVDYFHYTEDFHSAVITDNEGVSLERIRFDEKTNEPNNWISAVKGVGYATPGYLNSQMRKEIANNRGSITIDPKVIVPDGSGQRDFATISYLFNQSGFVANVSIMDVQGRKIKSIASNDYLGADGFYNWDGTDDNGQMVRVGYYIVYVEVFNTSGTVQMFKEKVVVGTHF